MAVVALAGAVAATGSVGATSVALAASGSSRTTSAGSATATSTGTAVTVRLVGSTSPAASLVSSAARPRGPRVMPLLRPPRAGAASATQAPIVASARLDTAAAARVGRVVHNFDGIDALQNRQAAGFDLEPPDEGLGAGNGYVANFVNVTGAIYTSAGRMVRGPFYLNTFFRESPAAFTSDPRVYFDPSSRRWFASILQVDFNSSGSAVTGSRVDLAVSTTANPTGRWRVYRIDTSNPSHAGCPCLADYPILGVSRQNVYLSTQEFTSNLNNYNGSQLYALSKRQLIAGAAAPRTVLFPNLSVAGTLAYHVQPANTTAAAPAEYLMSSLDPFGTYDNRLAVWAVTNEAAVSAGGRPTLSVRVVHSEPYSFPPNAQTPPGYNDFYNQPTTGVVTNDFDAMQEVQYVNGVLVGALDTGVTIPGDNAERSGVAWFVVRPRLSGAALGSGTRVVRQGYLSMRGEYLLYPHVNMTNSGAMAMTFGLGGPGTYLSAAYATAAPGAGFTGVRLAAAGVTSDNGFTATQRYGGVGRWGDYSNGEYLPGTNTIWLATQYIPNNGTPRANWGNRVFAIAMP